jgi:hypothetical protein
LRHCNLNRDCEDGGRLLNLCFANFLYEIAYDTKIKPLNENLPNEQIDNPNDEKLRALFLKTKIETHRQKEVYIFKGVYGNCELVKFKNIPEHIQNYLIEKYYFEHGRDDDVLIRKFERLSKEFEVSDDGTKLFLQSNLK